MDDVGVGMTATAFAEHAPGSGRGKVSHKQIAPGVVLVCWLRDDEWLAYVDGPAGSTALARVPDRQRDFDKAHATKLAVNGYVALVKEQDPTSRRKA